MTPGGLTDEERLLQQTARDFAQKEIAPGAAERDEEERYDRALFTRMGELGLTAVPFPEEVGGAGFSYRAWTLVMEEIAYADMAMAVSLSVHILSQYPVVTWGNAEQKARWLPPMLAGEKLGAFALTEPQAGSDAAALKLRAERVGPADAPTAYRLTGTKIWITNAIEAEHYLVFATVDPAPGTKGITAFLVEKGTPGFRFGRKERKLGIRSDTASELIFEGAEVPVANRLGEEGQGYKIALSALGRGASRSPPRAPAWPRRPWTPRPGTSRSARRSAACWPTSRGCASCSRRWPRRWRRRGHSPGPPRRPRTAARTSPRRRHWPSGPPRTRR